MDIRETITINGTIPVKLQPYTELRAEQLQQVNKQIDEFVEKNPNITFQGMDRKKKAEFWMKKARILWQPQPTVDEKGNPIHISKEQWDKKNSFFTISFFEDKAFEYPILKKSEDFFLMQEVYL